MPNPKLILAAEKCEKAINNLDKFIEPLYDLKESKKTSKVIDILEAIADQMNVVYEDIVKTERMK